MRSPIGRLPVKDYFLISARAMFRALAARLRSLAKGGILEIGQRAGEEGQGAKRLVGYWMLGGAGAVFGIVVLGGLTRLTESGLSMVDWRLVHFRPPSSEADWAAYFERYKQYPEWQERRDMTLAEFKKIYWMEHAHRVYGRFLGLGIIVPSVYFLLRKNFVGKPWIRRVLIGSSCLVVFQVPVTWF